ncbi:MAG: hypothetical protein ACQEQC_06450 [Elusimicrobiota bacterium]
MRRYRYFRIFTFLVAVVITFFNIARAASWEDWELGGELGLAVGDAAQSGRLLSPALMITGIREVDSKSLELGLGYMFGSLEEVNYTEEEIEGDIQSYSQDVLDDAGKNISVKLNVVPMTVNFIYTIYDAFYIGGGIGMYHVFYSKEPLGNHRATPGSEPGETISHPVTTAFGFQQKMGMEVFPMNPNWDWFVGLKSFMTTDTPAGSLLGVTLGGKVRYIW